MRKLIAVLFPLLLLFHVPRAWPVDYAALKTEIALPAYAAKTDAQIADMINTNTVSSPADLSGAALRDLMFRRGKWTNIQVRAHVIPTGIAADAAIGVARNLVDLANGGGTINTSDPNALAQLQSDLTVLVSSLDIAIADRAAAMNLATQGQPQWRLFANRPLDFNDVKTARTQ